MSSIRIAWKLAEQLLDAGYPGESALVLETSLTGFSSTVDSGLVAATHVRLADVILTTTESPLHHPIAIRHLERALYISDMNSRFVSIGTMAFAHLLLAYAHRIAQRIDAALSELKQCYTLLTARFASSTGSRATGFDLPCPSLVELERVRMLRTARAANIVLREEDLPASLLTSPLILAPSEMHQNLKLVSLLRMVTHCLAGDASNVIVEQKQLNALCQTEASDYHLIMQLVQHVTGGTTKEPSLVHDMTIVDVESRYCLSELCCGAISKYLSLCINARQGLSDTVERYNDLFITLDKGATVLTKTAASDMASRAELRLIIVIKSAAFAELVVVDARRLDLLAVVSKCSPLAAYVAMFGEYTTQLRVAVHALFATVAVLLLRFDAVEKHLKLALRIAEDRINWKGMVQNVQRLVNLLEHPERELNVSNDNIDLGAKEQVHRLVIDTCYRPRQESSEQSLSRHGVARLAKKVFGWKSSMTLCALRLSVKSGSAEGDVTGDGSVQAVLRLGMELNDKIAVSHAVRWLLRHSTGNTMGDETAIWHQLAILAKTQSDIRQFFNRQLLETRGETHQDVTGTLEFLPGAEMYNSWLSLAGEE